MRVPAAFRAIAAAVGPAALVLAGALALPRAAAAEPVAWSDEGRASYALVHKFHEVKGESRKVQARASWDADQVRVQARALVDSFESGDANRDAHMLEVMEVEKYPFVTIRGVVGGLKAPTAPGKVETSMTAEVELHGKVVKKEVPLSLDFLDPAHVVVRFRFPESLEAHGIERPSLLFVKVDDDITIAGEATLERKP